jgi:uncharacterized protein with GYD domain
MDQFSPTTSRGSNDWQNSQPVHAYGGDDFFIIADVPDSITATAVSLAVNATGAVQFKTIVLITPEEVDAAVQKTVTYRPPGQ